MNLAMTCALGFCCSVVDLLDLVVVSPTSTWPGDSEASTLKNAVDSIPEDVLSAAEWAEHHLNS